MRNVVEFLVLIAEPSVPVMFRRYSGRFWVLVSARILQQVLLQSDDEYLRRCNRICSALFDRVDRSAIVHICSLDDGSLQLKGSAYRVLTESIGGLA